MQISKNVAAWLLILLPVVTFFGLFFRYTVNMPVNDDYAAVLLFLNRYVTATSFGEKLKLIFSQHNEHRIVYSRIWTLISYKISGNVNFNFLSLVGNLSLVGVGAIFFRKFSGLKRNLFLFVPIAVLLFNITSWENITFPMCAVSNLAVHPFLLLSLSFLTSAGDHRRKDTLWAVFFLFVALMTQGAGAALIPVSLLILLYRKEYKNLLIYGAFASLMLLLYFHHYDRPPQSGDLLTVIADLKIRSLLFVFAFLGNGFDYFLIHTNEIPESMGITTVIGFGFFLLFLYITKKKYYQQNPFNYSIMVLVITTSAMAAISRSSMSLDMAGASRYRINGCIFAISLYFWLIETYNIRLKTSILAILAVTAWYALFVNFKQYEYLSYRQQELYLEAFCVRSGDSSFVNPDKAEAARQREDIQTSARLNIFHIPGDAQLESFLPRAVKQTGNEQPDNSPLSMIKDVHGIHKVGNDYLLDGYAFLQWRSTTHQKVFIGIRNQSDSSPVFFSASSFPRFDLNPYFHHFDPQSGGLKARIKAYYNEVNLRDGGFRARISADDLKPGENSIWLRVEVNNEIKTIQTESKIQK